MRDARAGPALKSWRVLLEAGSVAGLADGTLLERFLARRDEVAEVAFATLVARHGPMVRRVCRRLLVDPNDAEDAFQATFLVLARRAGAIRRPERLSSWLYGTAHRVSKKHKVQSARRRKHEAGAAREESSPVADLGRSVGAEAVLEEVARLPESYKAAVVLCELEGLTQAEAALLLGRSERTVSRHLIRARSLLRIRLTRRGLAPTATWLTSVLAADSASAAVTETIVDATARAAMRFASGVSTAGAVPASAVILAEGVIQAMLWTKLKGIAVASGILMALGVGAGIGAGYASPHASAPGDGPVPPKSEARAIDPQPSPADQYRALVQRYDDALKAAREASAKAKTDAERMELYKRHGPFTKDHAPGFVALAERFPDDPAAVDALLWVVERGLGGGDGEDDPFGRSVTRAMNILAHEHADEPRLGPLCLKLAMNASSRREEFLKAIAERSPDRVVKGRASLALAEALRLKGALAEMFQRPEAPVDLDILFPLGVPDDIEKKHASDPAAFRRDVEQAYSRNQPDVVKALKQTDIVACRREADRMFDRVVTDFGDVPYARYDFEH